MTLHSTDSGTRAALSCELIKSAYADLVLDESKERITVTLLCRQAGVNRSTFYAHYRTIDEVADDMELTFSNQLPLIDEDHPMSENLENYEAFLVYCRDQRRRFLALRRGGRLGDALLERAADLDTSAHRAPGRRNDQMHRLLVRYAVEGTLAAIERWLLEPEPLAPAHLAHVLLGAALSLDTVESALDLERLPLGDEAGLTAMP